MVKSDPITESKFEEGCIRERTVFKIPWNVFFAGLTSFLMDTATKMVYSVMPLFLMSIGASKTQLSAIEGIAESTASLLKVFSGWWSDRIGRRKSLMIIGYAISAIVIPFYSLAARPLHILLMRFVERIGKGIRTAPRDSLIAESSKCGDMGRCYGFHKAMDNCGAIAGPIIAFAIISAFVKDYRMVFLFAAIPSILSVINIIFFIREHRKAPAQSETSWKPRKGLAFRGFPKRFYFFLAIVFIFTLGNSTDALLLVKANETGISAVQIPLVYLVFNMVSVLLAVPAGVISDKIGREKLIVFGYFLYSIVYFGFGSTGSAWMIVLLFAVYGVYSASTDGVQKALVADMSGKGKYGTGMGIYQSLIGVTLLPASIIAGLLYDNVNASAPFYFGAATAFLAAVLMAAFLIMRRKTQGSPQVDPMHQ